jgi:hypothetical protein
MPTTLHRDSWEQYATICEQKIAAYGAENERLRAALAKAAQTFIELAPKDGETDAAAYFQAAINANAALQTI